MSAQLNAKLAMHSISTAAAAPPADASQPQLSAAEIQQAAVAAARGAAAAARGASSPSGETREGGSPVAEKVMSEISRCEHDRSSLLCTSLSR